MCVVLRLSFHDAPIGVEEIVPDATISIKTNVSVCVGEFVGEYNHGQADGVHPKSGGNERNHRPIQPYLPTSVRIAVGAQDVCVDFKDLLDD